MSNQINLVNRAYQVNSNRLNAQVIVGALVGVYLCTSATNMWQQSTITPMRSRLSQTEGELAQGKADMERAIAGSRKREPNKELADEVRRMEARLELQRELLVALETGGIGNTEGFSKYLTALARRRVEGVWLTGIHVTAVDGQIGLSGQMIRPDLLPVYIRELKTDEVLRGQGFAALDLSMGTYEVVTPAVPVKGAAKTAAKSAAKDTRQSISVVKFKLGAGEGRAER